MSELTRCNYCDMHDIKAAAERNKLVVTKRGDTTPGGVFPNGVTVLVHPPDVEPDRNVHYASWFAELTTRCVC